MRAHRWTPRPLAQAPCASSSCSPLQRGTPRPSRRSAQAQVIQPLNGDPFVSMLETPVTSSPLVVSYLSNLPAYRTGVSPLLRGVEIGLAHGFFLPGPFIKVCRRSSSGGRADAIWLNDRGRSSDAGAHTANRQCWWLHFSCDQQCRGAAPLQVA